MFQNAPKFIQSRFYSLQNYAFASLFPDDSYLRLINKYKKLNKPIAGELKSLLKECAILLTLFTLKLFFEKGTEYARESLSVLKSFEVLSFQIGNQEFTGENENVVRGEKLAKELLNDLDPEIIKYLNKKHYLSEIIDDYKKRVNEY